MAETNKDQVIKDAQYRKGLSIAYFNSLNAAIELAKTIPVGTPAEYVMDSIRKWRDMFLDEHKTYYASVIANVGTNYKPEETIKKLKTSRTVEELRIAWQLLSEDERQNKEIIKFVKELKAKYEKA